MGSSPTTSVSSRPCAWRPPSRPASSTTSGLGPLGASFYLWDRAVKDGDPRVIATLAYLTPLLSTLWLTLFGGGRLTPASVAAAVLIVGGAVVGSRIPIS